MGCKAREARTGAVTATCHTKMIAAPGLWRLDDASLAPSHMVGITAVWHADTTAVHGHCPQLDRAAR